MRSCHRGTRNRSPAAYYAALCLEFRTVHFFFSRIDDDDDDDDDDGDDDDCFRESSMYVLKAGAKFKKFPCFIAYVP